MNLKIVGYAVFINMCLALWPILAKKSGLPGYTVNLMYYIGSMIAISAIWTTSSKNIVTLHPKWIAVITGMGLLSGYCMHLYTTTVVDPKVQAGLFMVMSALMYAFFSLLFDWQINSSKLSGQQRIGVLFAIAAIYCLAGKSKS